MTGFESRPAPDECHEYYGVYIAAAPDGPVTDTLASQVDDTLQLLSTVSPEGSLFRYEPGKWSLREVVGHVVDSERMFAMRALAFARRDPARLPPFDEKDYAAASGAHDRPLPELAEELEAVRRATVLLFRGFREEMWDRKGIASGRPFTVRSLAWIIAGHELHHVRVLRERYMAAGAS